MRLRDHPDPVKGAATYWADHNDVVMKTTDGDLSVIDTKRTHVAAARSARSWQRKENAVVTREQKRLAKLAKS